MYVNIHFSVICTIYVAFVMDQCPCEQKKKYFLNLHQHEAVI